jgi:hypothetical protein
MGKFQQYSMSLVFILSTLIALCVVIRAASASMQSRDTEQTIQPLANVRTSFQATQVATRLKLIAEYNNTFGWLLLQATLTDVEGRPIANETIRFSFREAWKNRPTDGWFPVEEGITNENGTVLRRLGFFVPDDNYTARARHDANEMFGESEARANFEIPNRQDADEYGEFALPLIAITATMLILSQHTGFKNLLRKTLRGRKP